MEDASKIREESNNQLFRAVRETVFVDAMLLTTTLPRGGLHLVQPADVPESLVKAYSAGFDADDKLSWRVIASGEPLRMRIAWADQRIEDSPYVREFLGPRELAFGVALPLKEPVVGGYPGALHLLRSQQSGDFLDSEIASAASRVAEAQPIARRSHPGRGATHRRPNVYLSVMDGHFHDQLGGEGPASMDAALRDQMKIAADRQMQSLNGEVSLANRLSIPDAVGYQWNFRLVTYRRYPALGEGTFTFVCLQPGCGEWSNVRDVDFNADPDLARLLPAVRFMEKEFRDMPTLSVIAASVKLSPFHFHRHFTELMGITPKRFLLDCQIEDAKRELAQGTKSLARIAKDAGFAHQSHFTSRFKQATGLTPTRWRRLLAERDASNN